MIERHTLALHLNNGDKFTVEGDRKTIYTVLEQFENDDDPIRVENMYGKTVIKPFDRVWIISQNKTAE